MTLESLGQVRSFLRGPSKVAPVGVVGDLGWDCFVFGSCSRISPEAPVPVLNKEKEEYRLACAANVAANLAAFGSICQLQLDVFGVCGADDAGRKLASALTGLGKEVRPHLQQDPSRPTIKKTRFLSGVHQFLRVDEEVSDPLMAVIAQKMLADIQAHLPQMKCLILADYSKGTLCELTLRDIIAAAKKSGVFVLVDPKPKTPAQWYQGAGILTPNVAETEAILGYSLHKGKDDALVESAARELKQKLQLENCLVTRSQYGMTLVDKKDQCFHLPTFARQVFDVTGAGDTVIAMLALGVAAGLDLRSACILATAAAGVVVSKLGTATASPAEVLEEIDRVRS
jgi:rfaE bifunctional protein kinase chain/domain